MGSDSGDGDRDGDKDGDRDRDGDPWAQAGGFCSTLSMEERPQRGQKDAPLGTHSPVREGANTGKVTPR